MTEISEKLLLENPCKAYLGIRQYDKEKDCGENIYFLLGDSWSLRNADIEKKAVV